MDRARDDKYGCLKYERCKATVMGCGVDYDGILEHIEGSFLRIAHVLSIYSLLSLAGDEFLSHLFRISGAALSRAQVTADYFADGSYPSMEQTASLQGGRKGVKRRRKNVVATYVPERGAVG